MFPILDHIARFCRYGESAGLTHFVRNTLMCKNDLANLITISRIKNDELMTVIMTKAVHIGACELLIGNDAYIDLYDILKNITIGQCHYIKYIPDIANRVSQRELIAASVTYHNYLMERYNHLRVAGYTPDTAFAINSMLY